jgi:spermidine synthase
MTTSSQTETIVSAAAIAASVELYRQMTLRWNRTRTVETGDFDPVMFLDNMEPMTEEAAQAETDEMTAHFETLLANRRQTGCEDAYLILGFDLIFEMPQGKATAP